MIRFFFKATPTPEISTLPLHGALPISVGRVRRHADDAQHDAAQHGALEGRVGSVRRLLPAVAVQARRGRGGSPPRYGERESTRLNPRHANILHSGLCFEKNIILASPLL